jgi:hypothetical protein
MVPGRKKLPALAIVFEMAKAGAATQFYPPAEAGG